MTPINMEPLTLYAYIFIAGFGAVYFWRLLGLVFAGQLNTNSEILIWVRLVANALMSALVARIVFLPPGALETTELPNRLLALAIGLAAYFFLGRKLAIAVISSTLTFVVLETILKGVIF